MCSTAQKISSLVGGFAALVMLCPVLLSASSDTGGQARTGFVGSQNQILFKREILDTEARVDLDTSREDRQTMSAMSASAAKSTRIVQFGGSIRHKWVDALRATGAEIVGYVPNNAYIIRGVQHTLASVALLDGGGEWDDARPLRWMGRLPATAKLDAVYTAEMLSGAAPTIVDVEIELIDSSDSTSAMDAIYAEALAVHREPRRFLKFLVVSVRLRAWRLLEIANLEDVLFVGPTFMPKLHDERSAQIVAGNLTSDGTQPSAPGYMNWLVAKGFNTPTDFVIDFSDTGLDRGSISSTQIHPDFLDSQSRSRVTYIANYATDGRMDDGPGHGTIVASVACGRGAMTLEDAPGYMYGLGMDPAALLGASRIFDDRGLLPSRLSFTDVASGAYANGARISNNSWGNTSNSYDAAAQEFDSLVRDAQPSVAGNQELTFVFSVGNGGAGGHVSSPATAKNVISVAGSENYRPEGVDSCNLDGGGGIGPESADNALDILRYSSGGPTSDRRAKPDISAPGTHIYGAASQSSRFFGEGLCPGVPVFQPPGQSLYTWSSGTSLAAPHISGAASLLRRFFVARNLLGNSRPPSPAMTKAFLINSASFMTGANAGGNLPGERQGWGLVALSRAFDDTKRVLVDQTKLFTESGQTFEVQGSLADHSLPLRVTLAWTDAPGMLVGPAIVNDLDLEIKVGGVTLYRGNNFADAYSIEGGEPDRVNNVEAIYLSPSAIPAGAQGNFTITVRAANIAGDGVPGNESSLDQDFALVIYNIANSIIDPPPPPPKKIPTINTATYEGKRLTIAGRDFTSAARVEINGKIVENEFQFDSAMNSLSLKLKYKKLNLKRDFDNQIVLVEDGERSLAFVLRI